MCIYKPISLFYIFLSCLYDLDVLLFFSMFSFIEKTRNSPLIRLLLMKSALVHILIDLERFVSAVWILTEREVVSTHVSLPCIQILVTRFRRLGGIQFKNFLGQ